MCLKGVCIPFSARVLLSPYVWSRLRPQTPTSCVLETDSEMIPRFVCQDPRVGLPAVLLCVKPGLGRMADAIAGHIPEHPSTSIMKP